MAADERPQPSSGYDQTLTSLVPLVYAELRAIAERELDRAPRGRAHTLQPTALVHEVFLKMVGGENGWTGRDHFLAVAAKAMRQVLVDHARRRGAVKRGGGAPRADVNVETLLAPERARSSDVRVIELDALLTELTESSERTGRVAEMYIFGGMEQGQIARVLGVSRMTVLRDWQVARAWLAGKVKEERDGADR